MEAEGILSSFMSFSGDGCLLPFRILVIHGMLDPEGTLMACMGAAYLLTQPPPSSPSMFPVLRMPESSQASLTARVLHTLTMQKQDLNCEGGAVFFLHWLLLLSKVKDRWESCGSVSL